MSPRLRYTAIADTDVDGIVEYLYEQNPDAASRFLRKLKETEENLLQMPHLGSPYEGSLPQFSNLRYRIVSGFRNHVIYYRVSDEEVEVVRVLHGARDRDRKLEETE